MIIIKKRNVVVIIVVINNEKQRFYKFDFELFMQYANSFIDVVVEYNETFRRFDHIINISIESFVVQIYMQIIFYYLNIFHCNSYIFDSIYKRLYVFEVLHVFDDDIFFIVKIKKVHFFYILLFD